MFDVALDALAPRGKLLVIGMMSQARTRGAAVRGRACSG